MRQTFHILIYFYALEAVFADCYFKSYTTWEADWYGRRESRKVLSIVCYNTTIEDYTYALFDLDVPRQYSENFLQLSITNSNFSFIKNFINPLNVRKERSVSYDFLGLSLNFCGIKTIVRDAFKDFDGLSEVDLGFNDIDNLNFVSYFPSSIKKLNLTNNKIKDVDFELFTIYLDSLDLSFNRIIHLEIFSSYFPIKRYLYLNNNNITKIELHHERVSNALEVNLSFNNITFIENNSDDYIRIHIKALNISHSLTDLEILNGSKVDFFSDTLVFANNKLLNLDTNYDFSRYQHVDFSNCSLNNIKSVIFQESSYTCLNFSHNNLKLLSSSLFAGSNIDTLDLSHNIIENINYIFQHAFIFNLNLTANRISKLTSTSFENLEFVHSLDLSFNNLKLGEESFINCKDAVVLNLASCKISEISTLVFSGLVRLETLNLENNLLEAIHTKVFIPLLSIREINLLHNKLTTIQSHLFSSLPLISIVLSGNDIEKIEARAFHNLTRIGQIEICGNRQHLTIENNAFSYLPQAREIYLQKSKLSEINIRMFSEVPALKVLNAKDNNITSIDFSSHTEYMHLEKLHITLNGDIRKKSFLKLLFLKELTFWNSNIGNIESKAFQGLFNLETLELKNTKIGYLENGALYGLFTIMNLDATNILNYNLTLNSFAFKDLHSIENLNLSHANLESIMSSAFAGLKSIRMLDLSNNKIAYFQNATFSGLENLLHLNLSHNNLTTLKRDDFKGLIGLNTLNLNDNNINDMDLGAFQNFPELESLSLAQNNLTEFKVGAFSNLINLRTLDIQQNSISSLLFESFLPLKSLSHLNLEFNNLKKIEHLPLFSNLQLLKRIGIAKNKWKCDYLADILVTFRKYNVDYSSDHLNFYNDNIEGIDCIDLCKYLLCLKDSHGIN